MAALAVIVEESGGRFTSLAGQPGPHGGDALTTNGKLHDQALAFVGSVPAAGDPDEPGRPGGSVHDLSSHRRRPTT
jgi:histidinol-phosphatase